MKRKLLMTLLIITSVSVLCSCIDRATESPASLGKLVSQEPPSAEQQDISDRISDSYYSLRIGDQLLSISDDINRIKKLLGEPSSESIDYPAGGEGIFGKLYFGTLQYDGLIIGLTGDSESNLSISSITLNSEKYQTGGEVRVGNTVEQLQTQYPEIIQIDEDDDLDNPNAKRYENQFDNSDIYSVHVEYIVKNERIIEISIFQIID